MAYTIEKYYPACLNTADIAQLRSLFQQLFRTKKERAGELSYASIGTALKTNHLWMARTDTGAIISMAYLIPNIKMIASESYAVVHDVVTEEKYRGKVSGNRSLAEAIHRTIIEFAKLHKYKYLELTADPSRDAAKALYARLGYQIIAFANCDDRHGTNLYRLYLNKQSKQLSLRKPKKRQ